MTAATIAVIAKSPVAGRAKTRLSPPCTPEEAATLAAAALHDTLVAVSASGVPRRVVVLDGPPGEWLPPGFSVIPQPGGTLGERLAAAFAAVGPETLMIGMDTPQVQPCALGSALEELARSGTDAVLGLALDGGWWALGLKSPDAPVFTGVPMSTSDTGARQLMRLRQLGLRTRMLPTLVDVDHYEDALEVARMLPEHSRFAHAVRTVAQRVASDAALAERMNR